MIIYSVRCPNCRAERQSATGAEPCICGGLMTWYGMRQVPDSGAESTAPAKRGFKIAPDLSGAQQAFIETPEVQAKLKTGEYTQGIQKGSDEWNHAH